jgi:hydrogenase maturation protease
LNDGRIVVLGVGNLLWADEGFGVRCAEALEAGWTLPAHVEVVDGGTQGLGLIPVLQRAERVILFDAVDYGGEPGSLVVARDADVPRFMSKGKMSLHQAGMNDVLACLEMLGHAPQAFTLIGLQPVELEDYGGSLTPLARECVPRAIELAVAELRAWGVTVSPRAEGAPEPLTGSLALDRYESGRPSSAQACRHGDERFLAIRARADGDQADRSSTESAA